MSYQYIRSKHFNNWFETFKKNNTSDNKPLLSSEEYHEMQSMFTLIFDAHKAVYGNKVSMMPYNFVLCKILRRLNKSDEFFERASLKCRPSLYYEGQWENVCKYLKWDV